MARIIRSIPADLLELAELELARWPEIRQRIRASGHPTCDGGDGGDGDGGGDGGDGGDSGDGSGAGAGGDGGDGEDKTDWKALARKHENRAKASHKENEDLKTRLAALESKDKSEHDKALEQARKEARDEALAEANKDRRQDRLDAAVTKLASTGVKVKQGDKEVTARFADPDDALLRIERAIREGDLSEDDIFNTEGKVQTEALTKALAELLQRHSHLRADKAGRVTGDGDGGKGSAGDGDNGPSMNDRIRRRARGST